MIDSALKELDRCFLTGGPELPRPSDRNKWRATWQKLQDLRGKLLSVLVNSVDPAAYLQARKEGKNDLLPAELSFLYIAYACLDGVPREPAHKEDAIWLLASDSADGYLCAAVLRDYLRCHNLVNECHRFLCSAIREVKLRAVGGLNPTDVSVFQTQGLTNFARIMRRSIEAHKLDDVVINFTGGFKRSIPYATLLSTLLPTAHPKLQYVFERSTELVTIPALPIYFDFDTWRDYRGLVQAIGNGGKRIRGIVDALPAPLKAAYLPSPTDNSDLKPSFVLKWLKEAYGSTRSEEASKFGKGLILADHLDEPLRDRYERNVSRWQYGWLGDQVPEMVEHQRGHTQRILEFASQLLTPIFAHDSEFLSSAELYVLLCAIWLHDIGHSVPSFKLEDGGTEYRVAGLPTAVRDFHHLLAAYALDQEARCIKKSRQSGCLYFVASDEDPDLVRAVAHIARYHRQSMPLLSVGTKYQAWKKTDENWQTGQETVAAFQQLREPFVMACPDLWDLENGSKLRLAFLAALYRVLDASDVQAERVGTTDMIALRKGVIKMDAVALLAKLKGLSSHINFADVYKMNENRSKWPCDWSHLSKSLESVAKCRIGAETDRPFLWASEAARDLLRRESISEVYREFISAAMAIAFKSVQAQHYEKHKGVHTIVHKYAGLSERNGKRIYRFETHAVEMTRGAALKALNEIKQEYWAVKSLFEGIKHSKQQPSAIRLVTLYGHGTVSKRFVRSLEAQGDEG